MNKRIHPGNVRQTGSSFEAKAGAYLLELGYEILQYNYRCRYAEIDIVAKEGEYLVFCEVKYRAEGVAYSLEAVNKKKQQRISRAALFYMAQHAIPESQAIRFDVAGMSDNEIKLIKDAFDYVN